MDAFAGNVFAKHLLIKKKLGLSLKTTACRKIFQHAVVPFSFLPCFIFVVKRGSDEADLTKIIRVRADDIIDV